MEKDIIQPVNISILNDMLKEKEQQYEKRISKLENKIQELNSMIKKIKELSRVNSINCCWTLLNICDDCPEKTKCRTQSPFTALKIIHKLIEGE